MASAPLRPDDILDEARALLDAGQGEAAERRLRDLVQAGDGGVRARLLWSEALCASGRAADGFEAARQTVLTHPDRADAALCCGDAALAKGDVPSALGEYERAIWLDPDLPGARAKLGAGWIAAGEPERALSALAGLERTADVQALESEADALLQAARCDPRYVRVLFDQFSADYDERMLNRLGYRAPQILRGLFDLLGGGRQGLAMLDLGCGTGLGAAAFADVCALIDGVDLAPAMVEKARGRGLYRQLFVGDIESHLQALDELYDLIVAADTLVYLGDLSAVFAGASARLGVGGLFLFTVERCSAEPFARSPKQRWQHSQDYVRAAAEAAGLSIAGLIEASPRAENGVPVEGFAVGLTKTAEKVG